MAARVPQSGPPRPSPSPGSGPPAATSRVSFGRWREETDRELARLEAELLGRDARPGPADEDEPAASRGCVRGTRTPADAGPRAAARGRLTRDEAVGLLATTVELIGDADVHEALAALDDGCGGLLAAWRPPWVAAGVEAPSVECLAAAPAESVISWAEDFADVVHKLATRARDGSAPRRPEDFASETPSAASLRDLVAVVPDVSGDAPLAILRTMLGLLGGRIVRRQRWRAEAQAASPAAGNCRCLHLDAFGLVLPEPPLAGRTELGGGMILVPAVSGCCAADPEETSDADASTTATAVTTQVGDVAEESGGGRSDVASLHKIALLSFLGLTPTRAVRGQQPPSKEPLTSALGACRARGKSFLEQVQVMEARGGGSFDVDALTEDHQMETQKSSVQADGSHAAPSMEGNIFVPPLRPALSRTCIWAGATLVPHKDAAASGLRSGFLVAAGARADAEDKRAPQIPNPVLSRDQDLPAEQAEFGADTTGLGDAGPASIQFLHLGCVRAATAAAGEAAGVVLGFVAFLQHPNVQRALESLDVHCGGIIAAWRPPWTAQGHGRMDLDCLANASEAAIASWAMNLAGFVEFLRSVRAAVSAGMVAGVPAPSFGAATGAEAALEATSATPAEPLGGAAVPAELAAVEVATSPVATRFSGSCTPLVAVLPDSVTPLQVQVLGSLGNATGVWLIFEKTWHVDFGGAEVISFSMETLPLRADCTAGRQVGEVAPAAVAVDSPTVPGAATGPHAHDADCQTAAAYDAEPGAACAARVPAAVAKAASSEGGDEGSVAEAGATAADDVAPSSTAPAPPAEGPQGPPGPDTGIGSSVSWARLGLVEHARELSRAATAGLVAELQAGRRPHG